MEESLLVDEFERIGEGEHSNYNYEVRDLNTAAFHLRGIRREGKKHRVHNYACDFLKFLNQFHKARPSGCF